MVRFLEIINIAELGINPEKVLYLKFASLNLDNKIAAIGQINNIKTIGENINSVRTNYKLLDEFQYLRL